MDEYFEKSKHEGLKRNRVRIPKKKYDVNVLDTVERNSIYRMTSTSKNIGLKQCQKEQQHDPVKIPSFRLDDRQSYFIYCRRCGDIIGYLKDETHD